jgi:RHS repeat-associated protein
MVARTSTMTRLLLQLVSALAFLIGAETSYAHDFGGSSDGGGAAPPPPGPPCNSCPCAGPGGGGGKGPGNSNGGPPARRGKPVSLYNGAEEMTVSDLTVNGVFPILIQRKYDNQSNYDSPLGHGWAFLHDRRLYEYPDNSVVVRHGCGTRDRYVESGGGYVTPVGSMLANLSQQPDGTFTLRYLNGVVDAFDSLGRLTAVSDAQGNRLEYSYDVQGKLPLVGSSKESIAPSQPMTVAYNHRLTRIDVRGADGALTGRHVTFEYDENTGRLTSVTADDGRTITYQHDVSSGLTLGNLTQVNGLEGIVSTYVYADPLDPHNLTSITPAQGRTPIVNTYDNQDRVTRQEEGTRRMDIVYDTPYVRTTVTRTITDHNGANPYTAAAVYEFDTTGRVTKLTDELGNESRYTYNAAKMPTRKELWQKIGTTLSLLQATGWSYDANGNKITESVVLDTGETVTRSWTYDHDWIASEQVVSSATPAKIFRTEYTFHYDAAGRPTNIQSEKRRRDDGSFQITTYSYDTRNRLLTTTWPDGVQSVNEYTGDYVTRTYFVDNGNELPQMQQRFEYGGHGDLIKEWDGRNNLTTYEYDDRHRLLRTINPLGEATVNTYEQDRLVQTEVGHTAAAGEGQVTRMLYDARDRLIGLQRKNDAGAWVAFWTIQLDSEDQRLAIIDAGNRTTRFAYDVLGRQTHMVDAANGESHFEYDAAGRRTHTHDALDRIVNYQYDDLDRMIAQVEQGDSSNPRTEMTYDAAGNRLAVKHPEGGTISYEYDALSRNTRVTQPLGQFVQYDFDNRDRVSSRVNARGGRIEYDYEAWGALQAQREYANGAAATPLRTIAYTRDNDSNVLSVVDSDVQAGPAYTMTYDALSRIADETIKYIPGGDKMLLRRYDRFGNRSEVTLLDGDPATNLFTYNKLNQLSGATLNGAIIELTHFADDDWQSVGLPNHVTETFSYRPNGLVETIQFASQAGLIEQLSYLYDPAMNVDTQQDSYGLHDFNYDGLNRLTGAIRPAEAGLPNESYAYDRAGNREDPSNAAVYQYDANNRIGAGAGLTYTFDADGNVLTRSDGAAFTHDIRNRMRHFAKGAVAADYLLDESGRRIRKVVNSATTWYLWEGTQLIAEYDAAGTRTARYGYLESKGVATQFQDANATYYVHSDHLETPRLMTDATARVTWKARHEAFGKAIVESDPDGDGIDVAFNQRLPGQYADAESGLHYNYQRDYDPQTGRYLQSDPIGVEGGVNLFLYVNANPVNYADPTGEAGPAAGAAAAVALFCARNPRLCAAVFKCLKNPKACAKPACNAACRSYQLTCKKMSPRSCDGKEGCYGSMQKCGQSAACCIGRSVCSICRHAGLGHADKKTGQRTPRDQATEDDCRSAGKCCKQVTEKCGDCYQ